MYSAQQCGETEMQALARNGAEKQIGPSLEGSSSAEQFRLYLVAY